MAVKMSVAVVQSVRSVSTMEIECMDSSNVLGIFCASAMCSKAVARLSYVINCCIGIGFLARRNSRASVGVWTVTSSRSICRVGWELVCKRRGSRFAVVGFLGFAGLPGILTTRVGDSCLFA